MSSPCEPGPAEWRSRGYLSHFDRPGLIQAITFRLYDSVPAHVIARWKAELQSTAAKSANASAVARETEVELHRQIARCEDAGYGACWLRAHHVARIIEDALLYFDGERYRLLAWCIMPNHVHALGETMGGFPLGKIAHSWKSFTATQADEALGRAGTFWLREYHDRYIRDADHFDAAVHYIEQNPVKARLVREARDWKFSSVARRSAEP